MAKNIRHRNFNKKYGSFSRIHDSVKGHINEIEAKGLALYVIIASHAIKQEYIWCSQDTLAKEMSVTVPTIIKYLRKLENAKLIKRVKQRRNETDIIHLLQMPKVLKTFNQGTKNPLVQYSKSFSTGTKNPLVKSYKEKQIKRNRVNESIAKFEDDANFADVYFNKLIDMFNKGFKKLNKTNRSKAQQSISSLAKLNKEGIKKKRIKEVMQYWLKNISKFSKMLREINSIKDFCENFGQIEREMEYEDDD